MWCAIKGLACANTYSVLPRQLCKQFISWKQTKCHPHQESVPPFRTLRKQVCEDLVKMINEDARIEFDGRKGKGRRSTNDADIFGENAWMDYSKPFQLFDEQGLGAIPVDQFRAMLYKLRVSTLLRERQMVALIDRFDVDHKGKSIIQNFNVPSTRSDPLSSYNKLTSSARR